MKSVVIGLVVSALLLSGSNAVAQSSSDIGPMKVAIERILGFLREHEKMPAGTIRLDSRELEARMVTPPGLTYQVHSLKLGAQRDSATQRALLTALSAEPGDATNPSECLGPSKRSCRMKDAVAVFAVSPPFQRDSVVEVFLQVEWATGFQEFPVSFARYALTVAREGPFWTVRKVRLLSSRSATNR